MNNDRLKAGVTQATAASALFKTEPLDITSFQKGLTAAEEAIYSLKVASGMAVNYQTSPPYNIAQKSPEELRAAIAAERIEMGEGSEEEETPSFEPGNIGNPFKEGAPVQPNIPSVTKLPTALSGIKRLPPRLGSSAPQLTTLGPKTGIRFKGGRRTYRQKKRRTSTHKRHRV